MWGGLESGGSVRDDEALYGWEYIRWFDMFILALPGMPPPHTEKDMVATISLTS